MPGGTGFRTRSGDGPSPAATDRGQSIQVAFVVLLGVAVTAAALWQAQVVPAQNARAEYRHNQAVEEDLEDVRAAILAAPERPGGSTVPISMSANYPKRDVFVNPGPPAGSLSTAGTTDPAVNLTIVNATALDAEVADYWNGSNRSFNTGALVYDPNYNVYTGYPLTVYENSVLYDDQGETNVTVAGQDLIDGTRLQLVALNGSLSVTRTGSYGLDLRSVSVSTRTVSVTNTSGNLTLRFATRLSAAKWRALLEPENVSNGGHVLVRRIETHAIPVEGFRVVEIPLEGNVTYELQLAKVGVGSRVTQTDAHYLVDVAGDGSTVEAGATQQLVVEVRDRFNNPVSGVTVRLDRTSVSGDPVSPQRVTTGADGRAVFTFSSMTGGTHTVTFNVTAPDSTAAATNVTFQVEVTGGTTTTGGAYDVAWNTPPQPGLTCSGDSCTYDAGADSADNSIELETTTDPTAVDAAIDYDQNDTSVGSFSTTSATTGSGGTHTVTYTASENGTTKLYTWGRGDGDWLVLTVTNLTAGGGGGNDPPVVNQFDVVDNSECSRFTGGGACHPNAATDDAVYDVTWDVSDPDGDLASVTVYVNNTDDGTTATYTGSSGSITHTDTGDFGDSYEIKIIAKDTNGNRECLFVTDTADGSGSFTKSDASSC